jgi:hypothetical protein
MDKETEKKGGRTHGQICILGGRQVWAGWKAGRQAVGQTGDRQKDKQADLQINIRTDRQPKSESH